MIMNYYLDWRGFTTIKTCPPILVKIISIKLLNMVFHFIIVTAPDVLYISANTIEVLNDP